MDTFSSKCFNSTFWSGTFLTICISCFMGLQKYCGKLFAFSYLYRILYIFIGFSTTADTTNLWHFQGFQISSNLTKLSIWECLLFITYFQPVKLNFSFGMNKLNFWQLDWCPEGPYRLFRVKVRVKLNETSQKLVYSLKKKAG